MLGQAFPRRPEVDSGWPQIDTAASIPALAQVNQNLDLLSGLRSRQERVLEVAQSMQSDLITWQESVEREVQEILEKYPLEISPPALSAIDSDNMENDRLPLTPQVLLGNISPEWEARGLLELMIPPLCNALSRHWLFTMARFRNWQPPRVYTATILNILTHCKPSRLLSIFPLDPFPKAFTDLN